MGSPGEFTVKIEDWVIDAADRYNLGDLRGAMTSLSFARLGLMHLQPGQSYPDLEELVHCVGVKLSHQQVKTSNES